ncbi:putative membrane protein [Wickerhamomyces ciferrii]|uniref:Membrane protein n=1 Tax=Wickerhamomyces ciferrii (strain ATCC 14091 / BCRC 22168 / CBS 111 / JCM 3599 / NBRC 0793 / NRRL Y-1031 F-60-10) TaxID=1206466 RepID=K0KLB2_WICCF|nr:uncharacterized protein BN7_1437 [Wickerhamomyces ciferrii]CCH41898.1 putative membrane protein [Wickerhamomyces ciferrii]
MNEAKRQQTTKGIWLGYSPEIESSKKESVEKLHQEKIFVMDVEGSDGRERGEDQDFERKAALFALSTSEVLIVNIWEHQVGLYQGANMGLLKTVFEVNLSLFGNKDHKVLLLFVIRDHVGSTPLSNLSSTLTTDLEKMWDGINKPSNVDPNAKLSDYFDLEFTALAHKVLQPEKFHSDVVELGDRFSDSKRDDYFFKTDYKQNFPIDGWTVYAERCWDQIQSNKDLDLPTQQILVARFRCDEIMKESLELFDSKFNEVITILEFAKITGLDLSKEFLTLSSLALESFDSQASHYNKAVYESKRSNLKSDINLKLRGTLVDYIKFLKKSQLEIFTKSFNDKSTKKLSFAEKSIQARSIALTNFTSELEHLKNIDPEAFDYQIDLEEFSQELDDQLIKVRENEIENLINKLNKKINPLIKNKTLESLSTPDENMWDRILENFQTSLNSTLSKYKDDEGGYDFKIVSDESINKEIKNKIEKSAWISFDLFIHDYLNEDNVVNILRRQFEDVFSYDKEGIPRTWKTESEISIAYSEATEFSLGSLPLFSIAKLSNGTEILPPFTTSIEEEDDDDDEEDPHSFAHILSATQQSKIKKQFLKLAEISYRDANRSIISNISRIPPFMYALLIILGWNEFMAILRNPLLLVLVLLIGTGVVFIHSMNLWGPVNTAFEMFLSHGKQMLRNVLLDEPQQPVLNQRNSSFARREQEVESFEMDDLSEKKHD